VEDEANKGGNYAAMSFDDCQEQEQLLTFV